MIKNVTKLSRLIRVTGAVVIGLPIFILSEAGAQEPAPAAPTTPTTGSNIPPANAPAGGEVTAERVIVTGSNIPTAEEVGPNPVDTYRRDDITRLGVRTPTDLIQRLPAVTGSNLGENVTNGGAGVTQVSLRGIDPKETLILQDGRRLANFGFAGTFVDFNTFPLGLIDHIDILKDGASPVYGTDAVAGVINVFLRHQFRGLEMYASYGNTNLGFAGDAGQETGYLLAGTGDDKTNIVVYASYFNNSAIFSRDVNIAHDSDRRLWGGIDPRSGNLAGKVASSIGNVYFIPGFGVPNTQLTPTPHFAANGATDPEYHTTGAVFAHFGNTERLAFNFGDLTPTVAQTDRTYLYGSFDRDICDKYLTAFADFKYFRQFWDGGAAPTPFVPDIWTDADRPFGLATNGVSISVPTQNAFSPFTVPNYISVGGFNTAFPQTQASAAPAGVGFTTGVRYRSLEAGLRTDKQFTEDYVFTGGLKGNLGEFADAWDKLKTWEWETGIRWNENYRVQRFGGIVNNNALRVALLDTNPATAFNPFGINQNTTFVKDAVFITTNHVGWTTLLTEDFRLNGDLFDLPGGPLSFALGSEHLTNHTSDNPDPLVASGQTTGATNFAPTRGSRDSWSQYWELRVPFFGPTFEVPGFHSLEFDYAERYENYSDFGSTERPKFSVRWQPVGGSPVPLTLRAAYIEAFHAPALAELFGGAAQSFPGVTDPYSTATEPQVTQNITSNRALKPEVAYEYTYGGVLTPEAWWSGFRGLTLSADLVHIDVRGFTAFLDPNTLINLNNNGFGQFQGQVIRDPGTNAILLLITPTQNLGRFITTSWDYEVVQTLETSRFGHGDFGTFTGTFNGTYLVDADIQFLPNGKRHTIAGKWGAGFQGSNGFGNYTHNRWYTSLFWDGPAGTWMSGIDTGVVFHYIGQYWDIVGDTANSQLPDPHTGAKGQFSPVVGTSDRKVREWTTVDLIFNYTFNLPPPAAQNEVAGFSKDGGKNVKMKDGKEKNVTPVSTAEYNPCGWRAWLNNTTFTLGVDNIADLEPPFVAGFAETSDSQGYDEGTANDKGRFWYVAIKKQF